MHDVAHVHEIDRRRAQQVGHALERPDRGVFRGREALVEVQGPRRAVDQDEVGERPPDVESDSPGRLHVSGGHVTGNSSGSSRDGSRPRVGGRPPDGGATLSHNAGGCPGPEISPAFVALESR